MGGGLYRPHIKIWVIMLLGGVWGMGWLYSTFFWPTFSENVQTWMGLSFQECLLEGRLRTSEAEILRALNVPWRAPIWKYSLPRLQKSLEALPWVKQAILHRRLPATLHVRLTERTPLAIWQHQGQKRVLDEEGKVIAGIPPKGDYVVLIGEKAPQHAWDLLRVLESMQTRLPKVRAAVFLRSGRWDLYLADKTIVKLPEHNLTGALERLSKVLTWRASKKYAISTIDLRFVDAVILDSSSDMSKKTTLPAALPSSTQQRRP